MKLNDNGQSLIVIMLILVITMISIPALVFLVQHETKWTVKQKKTTSAFHSAEAGIDRGVWKLKENSSNWNTLIDGGSIAGYTGTTVYDLYSTSDTAIKIGEYKINIFPGPNLGEVTVRSIGRDPSKNEVRSVEVVLSRTSVNSPLNVDGGIQYKPNLIVHWGPVVTFNSISESPSDYFPKKYSAGQIAGRDTDPTPPNSDGKEYWAYEELGNPPQIDLSYYKSISKLSGVPTLAGGGSLKKKTGSAEAVADPAGSGYFPAASNNGGIRFFGSYSFTSSTSVIYCDGTVEFTNNSWLDCLAVVGEGNVDMDAKSTNYTADVPANADAQYVKQKEMSPSYTFPGEGSATYTVANCGMHGFLYAGGNLNNAGGGSIMVGAAKVVGNVTMNTFTIYYDVSVSSQIRLSAADCRQVSWKEITTSW